MGQPRRRRPLTHTLCLPPPPRRRRAPLWTLLAPPAPLLQVLLLSTVYQLLQINHPRMKLLDVEGLLHCLHNMYEKSHRTITEALGRGAGGSAAGAGGEGGSAAGGEGSSAPTAQEVDEAIALELESMSFYLQILVAFSQQLRPGVPLPQKGETPPLGSDGHLVLIGAAAEYKLAEFCLHVLKEYLAVHDLALGAASSSTALAASPSGASPSGASAATVRLATRLLAELTPSIVTMLQGLLALHEPQFERHLPGFYPLFVDLMHCDSKELRQILRDIFSQRIGKVVHERGQPGP